MRARITIILLIVMTMALTGCTGSSDANYTQITQEKAQEMMQLEDMHIIIDVRTQEEFDSGHILGAICIPNETIGTDPPEELPDKEQILLIYCRSGNRSKDASQKLANMGYTNVYEFGGINKTVTEKLATAGKYLDIPLLDHCIIAGGTGEMYSFKANGLMDEIRQNMRSDICER